MSSADSIGVNRGVTEGHAGQAAANAPPLASARSPKSALLRPASSAGAVLGLIFMAAAFVPSLLPRPWYVQGVLSGMAIAVGYGVGAAGAGIWRRIRQRAPRAETDDISRHTAYLVIAMPVGIVIWMLVVHLRWQSDIRSLMGMGPGAVPFLIGAALTALAGGSLFVLAGRGVGLLFRRFRRLLERVMPRSLAVFAISVAVLVLTVLFFDLVVASRLIPALEAAHRSSDRSFDLGVEPPTSEMRSGGPGSVIEWGRMGRQGRLFATEPPSPAELEAFSGEPAIDPIRIYVGLEVADTAEARAQLALAEMERTGAFQRDVIVLVAPTGSGWIDPYAVEPLEYMYNGNTAATAVQYSYLASWMVMIRNQDQATDASRALYRAIRQRLDEEPESSRPELLLYGESLGSFGWERTFDGLDEVEESADGVLWVGPPRVNPLWRSLMNQRDPDSPIWRPVYEGGETVRFGPDSKSLLAPDAPWARPRIVYLQHASDPITWLSFNILWNKPEWLDLPRGPDVSSHMPYIPIVTYLQMTVDLVLGTNAPVGHGHKFGSGQAEAWSLILPPPGWDMADTQRLITVVESSE